MSPRADAPATLNPVTAALIGSVILEIGPLRSVKANPAINAAVMAPENLLTKPPKPDNSDPKKGIFRIASLSRSPNFSTTPEIRPETALSATPASPANSAPTTVRSVGFVRIDVIVRPSL